MIQWFHLLASRARNDANMELLFWLFVGFLITYRLAHATSTEEGPFRLFEGFRNCFTGDNWLGRGVRCPLCLSFWIGPIIWLLLPLPKESFLWGGWALSGFVLLIQHWRMRG